MNASVSSPRPWCIAHRGFSGRFPENTLAAFEAALDLGVDMIELDVSLSADGVVVVMHDETLDRTTSGRGAVRETGWAEIAGLDAGGWFGDEFTGERVPALVQVLELVRGRTRLNVEIKGEAVTDRIAGGVTERVIAHVHEAGMAADVILSSFDPRALTQAREIDAGIERASLYDEELHRGMTPTEVMDQVDSVVFSPGLKQVTPAMIADAHASGRVITVYTVDREADMRRLISLGVDGMFTNHPDVLLRLIASTP